MISEDFIQHFYDEYRRNEGIIEMSKVHYRSEKDLIIEQLWNIVFRALGTIDDAGCDWFTYKGSTFIGSEDWHVSNDPEIGRLVNAINALKGYTQFIERDINE